MNWRIAFFIWLLGLAIFAILCIVTVFGLLATPYVLESCWVAIPIYAVSLWFVRAAGMSYHQAMAFMFLVPTTVSVKASLYLVTQLNSGDSFYTDLGGIVFWIPFGCCLVAVFFHRSDIFSYLHPEISINEITAE